MGRWARIPQRRGEPFLSFTAPFVCFALWPVSGLATCGPHHSWELECRAVVPVQTAQTPLRVLALSHTSWTEILGVGPRSSLHEIADDSSGLRNHWPRPAFRVKTVLNTVTQCVFRCDWNEASTAPSTPGTRRAHWWWLLILFQFFKLLCHDPLNWFPSPLLGHNP